MQAASRARVADLIGERPLSARSVLATALLGADQPHLTVGELRRYCRAVMPNVYLDQRAPPSLRDLDVCVVLSWSRRRAAVAGLAASSFAWSRSGPSSVRWTSTME